MNRAQITASLALWTARRANRRRHWRWTVKRLKKTDARRQAAWHLYDESVGMVRKRRSQLARLPVTRCDQAGANFIANEEGVIPHLYLDSRGFATFGVGHLVRQGMWTARDARKWGTKEKPRYTKGEAVTYFRREDLPKYERTVARVFKGAKLTATFPRFNASTSLCFNVGQGGFSSSTVAERIRSGDRQGAADAFLLWDKPPELRGRRERERKLFLS